VRRCATAQVSVERRERARLEGARSWFRQRERAPRRRALWARPQWSESLWSAWRGALQRPARSCSPLEWVVERVRQEPPRGRRWPWSSWRPSSPSRPFGRQRVPRDVVRPRRHVGGCGPPERLRSTPRDSRRRCLVFGRVPATLCSLARVLWRARALVFSLEPKRSLTSCSRTFGGHSFLFFHNCGVFPVARPRNTATSDSATLARSARATWVTRTSFPQARSPHHHTPRPSPRPRYHVPSAVRPARIMSPSWRRLRHTTHVRVGAMPLPP
jgi:hypothetical protein